MTSHIIDAYNLIFQCGLHPKTLGTAKAMRQAHDRLFRELSERFEKNQRTKVIVVFDAKRKPDSSQTVVHRGFDVRYAYEYPDADAQIIELIKSHSQPKQLTVVSSDHQIQTAATRRGATAIDSDVWFDSVTKLPDNVQQPGESKPLLTKEEEKQWIENMAQDLENQTSGEKSEDKPLNPFPDGYADDLL